MEIKKDTAVLAVQLLLALGLCPRDSLGQVSFSYQTCHGGEVSKSWGREKNMNFKSETLGLHSSFQFTYSLTLGKLPPLFKSWNIFSRYNDKFGILIPKVPNTFKI